MSNRKYAGVNRLVSCMCALSVIICSACAENNKSGVIKTAALTAASIENLDKQPIDITGYIAGKNEKIITAAMSSEGIIWAIVSATNSSETALVKYDPGNDKRDLLHQFPVQGEFLPELLSASPAVVYSPAEQLMYVFGEGKNLRIIDMSAYNVASPCYCRDDSCFYWTDTSTAIVYRQHTHTDEPEEAFSSLLEYADPSVESAFGGGCAVISCTSLKDLSGRRVLACSDSGLIEDIECEKCVLGGLEGQIVKVCYSDSNFTVTIDGDVYSASIKSTIESCNISSSGKILLLCREGDFYQLLCYGIQDGVPCFVGASDAYATNSGTELDICSGECCCDDSCQVLMASQSRDSIEALYLWTFTAQEPTPLPLTRAADSVPVGNFGDKATLLAEEIEQDYGVQVLLGDDAVLAFPDYEVEPVYDEDAILKALRKLDTALSLYPDGYFDALSEDFIRGIAFCLVGDMHAINSANIDDPSAFAVIHYNTQLIAINILTTSDIGSTVCHEITHATDKKIAALAQGGEVDFSEEEWNKLNPDGFEYYNSYISDSGLNYSVTGDPRWTAFWMENDIEDIYFVDSYSKTFPTEDRARLMQVIMNGYELPKYMLNDNIQAKLSYYFTAIRQALGADWDEPPYWERALLKPLGAVTGQ